ncbi:MAG: hypothetical protein R2911_18600 [Caldilineaceae bacterium]
MYFQRLLRFALAAALVLTSLFPPVSFPLSTLANRVSPTAQAAAPITAALTASAAEPTATDATPVRQSDALRSGAARLHRRQAGGAQSARGAAARPHSAI